MSWIPEILLNSFTIFIPKKENTNKPSDLRPLSISSNLMRLSHKVLVKRISVFLNLDSLQFGFQPKDGVACAIDKLNQLITTNKKKLKSIFSGCAGFM